MPKWEEYMSEAKARGALAMELFVVRTYDIPKWLVNEGSLSFTVSLSSQSIALR